MNAAHSNAAQNIDHAAEAATAAHHRAAEPSMEEILASIRRIIADDEALPLAPRPAPRLVAEPSPLVLNLVNPAVHAAPAAPVFATAPAHAAAVHPDPFEAADFDNPVFDSPPVFDSQIFEAPEAAEPAETVVQTAAHVSAAQVHAAQVHAAHVQTAQEPLPLLSSDTSVAVHASFEQLAVTIMAQNAVMVEENVRSMLRPMLKSWLDDNLPVIVERLVRGEIERVARGGR